MGWTVLYIAFGAVALWLLGEVLLQYKARLRWRLLAFFGFLTVVIGVVVLSSVLVIGVGAVAFATGQTLVTLSYRKGFVAGWALDGLPGLPDLPGLSRRRDDEEREEDVERAGADSYEDHPEYDEQPHEADSSSAFPGVQEHPYGLHDDASTAAYAPQPLPEETGEYGVYRREDDVFAPVDAYQDPQAYPQHQPGYGQQQQEAYAAYSDPYVGYQTAGQQPAAAGYDGGYPDGAHGGYAQDPAYGGYDPYAAAGYPAQGYEQQPGYSDPQTGWSQAYDQQTGYPQAGYDDGSGYGGGYAGYDTGYTGGYSTGEDAYAYAAQQGDDPGAPQPAAPADGVWVPQPREGDDPYQAQSAQGYPPYQDGYGYYTDQHGGY
jgi:hypothetical protein